MDPAALETFTATIPEPRTRQTLHLRILAANIVDALLIVEAVKAKVEEANRN